MDLNDLKKSYERTPDGTKDTKEVSDNRKGSTMECPEQVTEKLHVGWNIKRRLWIANTAEFTTGCLVHPRSQCRAKLEKVSKRFGPSQWATQGSRCVR